MHGVCEHKCHGAHGELREQATLSSLISPSTHVGSGDQTQAQFDHLSE